jgi:pimeloyl-ACP methyl ester carboxylesterase
MAYAMNQNVRIHYELEGQGPPLVLQHGASGSLKDWYDLGYVKELGKDYKLILVDARGYGMSDKPLGAAAYRAEVIAGDYAAILKDLKIEKANYFGYSMGAGIGFKAIARYTLARFSSLVLGGGNPFNPRTEVEKQQAQQTAVGSQKALEESMEAYMRFLEKSNGPTPPERRAHGLANNHWSLLAFNKARSDWPGADDILKNIAVPCLVYAGEKDAACAKAKEAAALMPRATFVSFPGFNHGQCYFQSEVVIPHIRKFLAEVNGSQKS